MFYSSTSAKSTNVYKICFLAIAFVFSLTSFYLSRHKDISQPSRQLSSTPEKSVKKKKESDTPVEPLIPNKLVFTYQYNILETKEPRLLYENVQKTVDVYTKAWGSTPTVKFFTDHHCRIVLRNLYPDLLPYFESEVQGAFRGDICRIIALYKHGGYYFDVDVDVVNPYLLSPDVRFSTVMSLNEGEFFQAFMAAEPGHPVLRKALRFMHLYYMGHLVRRVRILGPQTLQWAYDSTEPEIRGKEAMLEEIPLDSKYWGDKYPTFPRKEGYGCCCNFVVHDPENVQIYFYSRIVGFGNRCSSEPLD